MGALDHSPIIDFTGTKFGSRNVDFPLGPFEGHNYYLYLRIPKVKKIISKQ